MARPNILFIVADDLGYADLGCYGGRDARFGPVSPALDALSVSGMRFVNGYANSPVCSPTRYALMTARYQYRLRGAAEEPMGKNARNSDVLGLPPSHPTLPSMLREAGYRTALIGKWHLGYPPSFGPLKSGYEEFYGPMAGGVDYFTHCDSDGEQGLWKNGAPFEEGGYLTDLLTKKALKYVKEMHGSAQPFFLSLHYTAPHWPWEARDDHRTPVEVGNRLHHLDGGSVEKYQRMIHHMDEGIGQIVQALRAASQLDNTLIVFTSDNGGERFSDNWPLVGGKMDLTEGGIRVPYIAHWPSAIPAGTTSSQICATMDWSATMLELGEAQVSSQFPLDGMSLLSVFRDPLHQFDRPIYWRMKHREQRAVRNGNWKYLKVDSNEYLFDVSADERERANRASHEPDLLLQMRGSWEAWNDSMPKIPGDAYVSVGTTLQAMPQR